MRGRKVISRFLDNEPRYLEPLLVAHYTVTSLQAPSHNASSLGKDGSEAFLASNAEPASWQLEYIVLLWLSHLVLTPFDLSTLSAIQDFDGNLQGIRISDNMPLVAKQLLELGMKALASPMSQRTVAADLLVRLSLRPDMRSLGLLDSVVTWALSAVFSSAGSAVNIHRCIGLLSLLSGIVASGAVESVGASVVTIYDTVVKLFSKDEVADHALQDSAVAKRLAIKIQRNILVQLLIHRDIASEASKTITRVMLESRSTLEDVVDFLLQSLADRDTQVRLAASKAISFIAQQLDQEMADEIVGAVIGSLNEDVLLEDGVKSYAAVNALSWHGLTMALSHMLFRRIPSPTQLLQILDALYLALTFEQRSSSGHCIGGNVRDAANFGLWSLARRYVTSELLEDGSHEVLQRTARHLVCAACLDPVGNVRRGSSAALQELVGRHPDTIDQGIALIQVVDYQAVGLRSRAMEDVTRQAASLASQYRKALEQAVYDWRGLLAVDQLSRESAAEALHHLVEPNMMQIEHCVTWLQSTPVRNVEGRHGLLAALASVARKAGVRWSCQRPTDVDDAAVSNPSEICQVMQLYNRLFLDLNAQVAHLRPPNRRPDLLARGVIMLIKDFVYILLRLAEPVRSGGVINAIMDGRVAAPHSEMFALFTAAIQASSEDSLELVQDATDMVGMLCATSRPQVIELARSWLQVWISIHLLSSGY